ncbi:MAG: response regulator [Cryobacterium sp.]|nr:response regulator [Oligoflexia bacterium]
MNVEIQAPSPIPQEICILGADKGMEEMLLELLDQEFAVRTFRECEGFEKFLGEQTAATLPDLILCDGDLPDGSGLQVLEAVRRLDPVLPFLFLVNQPECKWTLEAFEKGATDLIDKPFESLLFIDKFRGRIAQATLMRRQNELTELLQKTTLLTTTHANRLIDLINKEISMGTFGLTLKKKIAKLKYLWPDEEEIQFRHALKSEEKLLRELDQCRIEYLGLARLRRIF